MFWSFLTKTEIRSAMDTNAYTADIRTTKSGYLESDSADIKSQSRKIHLDTK